MDNAAKVWSLTSPRLQERIADAAAFNVHRPLSFPSLSVHYPLATVAALHRNYVDCVRYYGDLVLSKSTDSRILAWRPPPVARTDFDASATETRPAAAATQPAAAAAAAPGADKTAAAVEELFDFHMVKCEIWYVRFCVDLKHRLVFCGNQEGRITVWAADRLSRESGIG